MSTHAKLSPSASSRWMVCPGSINLIEQARKAGTLIDDISEYAAQGTVAHKIAEECLLEIRDAEYYKGQKRKADGFTFTVNDDMIQAVQVYIDYVWGHIENAEIQADLVVELKVEVKCSLKGLGIDGLDGGTSDTVLISPEHRYIEIVDYKHGAGVVVSPIDNTQTMQYGLGVLHNLGIDEFDDPWDVIMTIAQPRAFDPDGEIRSFKMSSDELFEWQNDVLIPAAKATQDPNAKLVPSDKGCRFCPVRGNCPALYEMVQETAMLDFDDLEELPNYEFLTTQQKINIMDNADLIRSFILGVENQMKIEMDRGSKEYNKTHKLVRTKTNRKIEEDHIDDVLFDYLELKRKDFYTKPQVEPKLKALGVLEKDLTSKVGKQLAKEIMSEITIKPEGKVVIAPLSDSRKAIKPSVVSDFEGLED